MGGDIAETITLYILNFFIWKFGDIYKDGSRAVCRIGLNYSYVSALPGGGGMMLHSVYIYIYIDRVLYFH